jgi:hypothetical protein
LESVHTFLVLEQDGDHNRFKRPGARDHDAGLDMELSSVKESVEKGLIGFGEGLSEGRPSAVFLLNELTKWRQGFAHKTQPPAGGRSMIGNATGASRDSLGGDYINDLLMYQAAGWRATGHSRNNVLRART